jgi:chemotaxis protein CheX
MDERIVAAFSAAALATFRGMFSIEAKLVGKRDLKQSDRHLWDVSGIVGLAGQAQGVVAFRLGALLASRLLSVSGVELSEGDDSNQLEGQLVGEIANIICGAATSTLAELSIEIVPPVVVSGPNHMIGWPAIAPVFALEFDLGGAGFELDLCVKS